jgi:hypothetical protein
MGASFESNEPSMQILPEAARCCASGNSAIGNNFRHVMLPGFGLRAGGGRDVA